MVTEASTPDFKPLDRMIMPSKRERPSTANTMCLILKPRQEDYKQLAQISSSENEREAYRKNRVIQMKLGAYLAEVCLQERSSARLLKTEEYRFMQEVSRRSSVPRSVSMLQQLQTYVDKKFPDATYSYCDQSSRTEYSHPHRHPPLSARGPARSHHQSILDRPKTSASMFRQNFRDAQAVENLYKSLDNHEAFVRAGAPDGQVVTTEELYLLKDEDDRLQRPATFGQTTELPSIWAKDNAVDSSQNLNSSVQRPQTEADPSTKRKVSMPLDRSNSLIQFRQRQNSLGLNAPLKRMNTISKFSSSDLPIREEAKKDVEVASDDSFEVDPNLVSLLDDELKAFDKEEGITESGTTKPDGQTVKEENEIVPLQPDENLHEDEELEIIDLDVAEMKKKRTTSHTPNKGSKQGSKPGSRRTSFNRVKAEPVMPLRHNITSVLRQERAKYEASQQKVKNYLHKMTGRDFVARNLNVRDTTSAHSRRSSANRK